MDHSQCLAFSFGNHGALCNDTACIMHQKVVDEFDPPPITEVDRSWRAYEIGHIPTIEETRTTIEFRDSMRCKSDLSKQNDADTSKIVQDWILIMLVIAVLLMVYYGMICCCTCIRCCTSKSEDSTKLQPDGLPEVMVPIFGCLKDSYVF